ncbi:MAG: cation:proton antiporter [Gammaproteobacteria bacterium]|nr:cation:proton antiporter [Gammaproteobacteria bacterium]
MDFQWFTIALGDATWISLAFLLGFFAKLIKLPPLVGFLAAGFALNYLGITSGDMLQKLADLGITLLLFTVGLKLNLRFLIRPQIWAVTALHTSITVLLFGSAIFALSLSGISALSQLTLHSSLLLAFALSFSSTVFVVKSLEEKGDMKSFHGRISIGILVMQDLLAVIFLAISTAKLPSLWAALLFLLIPLRPLLMHLLQKTGHGELLILYGLVLALGGAEVFALGGIKDDLGALIMGVLISNHAKSAELAKSMLGFKDLFLVGFFLSIGMSVEATPEALIIGALLAPFILLKSALFFSLMTLFKLRARTSLLTSLSLTNYSEFGLIIASIGVSSGWMESKWLVVMAITLSLSFVIAAPLNSIDSKIYYYFRQFWMRFERAQRLPDDKIIDTLGATIAIFGMGRVGSGAYDKMRKLHGETLVGVDFDADRVKSQQALGRNVIHGDPSDADFWEKIKLDHRIKLVMLALPNLQANLEALAQLKLITFSGRIATIARFPDEARLLEEAGASAVFNIYTEAGAGFAEHVEDQNKHFKPA